MKGLFLLLLALTCALAYALDERMPILSQKTPSVSTATAAPPPIPSYLHASSLGVDWMMMMDPDNTQALVDDDDYDIAHSDNNNAGSGAASSSSSSLTQR
jgi:hypothetical protein